ncbi:unnamed protein product [Pleuronectes platessa]|uniref:Uncharacterized protein n=1 Tax=Pleuronectes platessa TaxID=8262 RepID=A0A9N7V7B2_PLEPL|nr:unnamed protein product [Pleuronectes platessa]
MSCLVVHDLWVSGQRYVECSIALGIQRAGQVAGPKERMAQKLDKGRPTLMGGARVMRRGGWNRGMLGLYAGSFLTVSQYFAFQPFPFPALSSSLQQSHCLQRAFNWEHFDSAGCEA